VVDVQDTRPLPFKGRVFGAYSLLEVTRDA